MNKSVSIWLQKSEGTYTIAKKAQAVVTIVDGVPTTVTIPTDSLGPLHSALESTKDRFATSSPSKNDNVNKENEPFLAF